MITLSLTCQLFQYDHECDQGYVCEYNKCVEKPDPCDPNPCGMMAICTVDRYGEAKCECPRGTFGDGFVGCQQVRTCYSTFHRFGDRERCEIVALSPLNMG